MANRLLLNYDRSNKFHAEEVEKLLKVPSGSHASAVVIEEVADALRAAGVHSEAERILGEARGTPAGEVLRSFREGFGRLTTGARLVIRSLGYDPALGGTGNGAARRDHPRCSGRDAGAGADHPPERHPALLGVSGGSPPSSPLATIRGEPQKEALPGMREAC